MQKGFVRYKVSDLPEGTNAITFYKDGVASAVATVHTKRFCDNYKLIKYLNKKGQYRFFPFTNFYEDKSKVTKIGSVNKFIESIRASQSNIRSVGYTSERALSLVAEDVTSEQLEILNDLFTSPVAYLYVGNGTTDLSTDWIIVEVAGDGLNKRRKLNTGKVSIELKYPEQYSITLR